MSVQSRQRERKGEGNPGLAYCADAVRWLADHLGRDDLTVHDYEYERDRLLSRSRGTKKQELALRLPIWSNLQAIGWARVAERAGLKTVDRRTLRVGMERADALERHLMLRGFLPNDKELEAFAREEGFALAKREKSIRGQYVELFFRRKEQGLWTPDSRPRNHLTPQDFPEISPKLRAELGLVDLAAVEVIPHQPRDRWTIERIEAGLDEALRRLPPGQNLTASRLRQLASRSDGAIPSQTIVHKHAGYIGKTFSQLRDEALARAVRASGDEPEHNSEQE
jgi:hypothetical protein